MGGRTLAFGLCVAVLAVWQVAAAAETAPPAMSFGFPPVNGKFGCYTDKNVGVDPKFICTPVTDPFSIVLSNDNDVVSARYLYKTPVRFWKRGSKYVASFAAQFTVNFDRSSEFTVRELFGGGGVALAILPSLTFSEPGSETLGLFAIDEETGAAKNGAKAKTVAVEIDFSRNSQAKYDPAPPHVGLDINSVKSVQTKYLGDPAAFIDNKIGVWVDYDALKKTIQVFIHKVKVSETPQRKNANLFIKYTGLDLAKVVNELSYVGISSRVPETPNGVYRIYDFKFSTSWVQGNTVN